MFPSRSYLPASGLVPGARGAHKPKHARAQSMVCTYPCKTQTVQQSISDPTSLSEHKPWLQKALGASGNKSMSAHMQESA